MEFFASLLQAMTGLTMKLITFLFLSAITISTITGCSSPPPFQKPSQPANLIVDQYLIGVGDTLDIRVWRNPDLSVTVPVRPDGKISVPLAGEIIAINKSTVELQKSVKLKLTEYLKEPTVTVIISDARSIEFVQRVRITGAVNQPISTPWQKGMTVLDLVLLAGGSTIYASEEKALLYRKANGVVNAYPIDLDAILKRGELETNYTLSPSDIITVPERLF